MTRRRFATPPITLSAPEADIESAVTGAVRRALAGRPGMTAADREAVARATVEAVSRRLRATALGAPEDEA